MAKLFLSYTRQCESNAKVLAEDLKALGHTVWFDQELSGGQVWWDQILATVRDCDVFVFALDQKSLTSTACMREWGYAADLGKPILPVLVSGEISTNLLPTALSQIQFVDYRTQDREAAFRLARAITAVPPPVPLPDPLPPHPEVPVSYLGCLTDKVDTTSLLSFEEQSSLVLELKKCFRDRDISDDSRELLCRLRKRRDLLATIAEEIDELLAGKRKEKKNNPRIDAPGDEPGEINNPVRERIEIREHGERIATGISKNDISQKPTQKPNKPNTGKWKGFLRLLLWVIVSILLIIISALFFDANNIGPEYNDNEMGIAFGCFLSFVYGVFLLRRHFKARKRAAGMN